MYKAMNYRIYYLQCTYPYYAQNHINLILKNFLILSKKHFVDEIRIVYNVDDRTSMSPWWNIKIIFFFFFWDYNKFDPSKWSLDIRHLDRTIIEYLTWSTVNNSAQWKIWTNILMDGMLGNNSKFHPKKEFKRSIKMNDRRFNVLRATLLRYILKLLPYCGTP